MRHHIEVSVKGIVQGVCYRFYVKDKADELGITGWAKNCIDGSVSVSAECEKDILDLFIEFLKKGHPFAQVENIDIKWSSDLIVLKNFSIRF